MRVIVVVVAVMVMMVVIVMRLEEVGIVVHGALEVECAAVEHFGKRDARALGLVDPGGRVDGADGRLRTIEIRSRIQIGCRDSRAGRGRLSVLGTLRLEDGRP